MKILILIPILLLQGCMVAAIGAGIGAVRYANAEKSKAHTACKDSYINYVHAMNESGDTPISLQQYCPAN